MASGQPASQSAASQPGATDTERVEAPNSIIVKNSKKKCRIVLNSPHSPILAHAGPMAVWAAVIGMLEH